MHGARYRDFGRAGAEVVAETAAHIALSAARLDTRAQAVPYVAGWADAAPKELAGYADAVHRIAATLERGLGLDPDARIRELSVAEAVTAGSPVREPPVRGISVRAR